MPDGRLCHCILCHDYGDRGNADRMDLDISENIRRFGWHVVMVPEDDTGPGFAYTIGLTHSFGTPELAMFGLDIRIMHQVLNMLGQTAASGATLTDGQEHMGVLEQHVVVLRLADLRWHRTFFGQAIGFYRRPPLPVLQVCWPDSNGAFHWQADSADQHRQSQPRLWVLPSDHPRGVWTIALLRRLTITAREDSRFTLRHRPELQQRGAEPVSKDRSIAPNSYARPPDAIAPPAPQVRTTISPGIQAGEQGSSVTEQAQPGSGGAPGRVSRFDTSVPHPARIYNYWLGGKDNFAADREAAEQILTVLPFMRENSRANRLFLATAVHYLVQAGIRQFLDIGTGLPAANNTHEVAQQAAPDARIVYVDNDPIVLSHAQALLTSTPEGRCDYLDADARDPERILAEAARTLDFGQPVAVMMLALLHFIPDDDHPHAIAARLMEAVPSGSYLALTHAASDIRPDAIATAVRGYNATASAPFMARPHSEVAGFFQGLELVPPGVVPLGEWTPGTPAGGVSARTSLPQYAGLARKP